MLQLPLIKNESKEKKINLFSDQGLHNPTREVTFTIHQTNGNIHLI